jgi:hypothetical protein
MAHARLCVTCPRCRQGALALQIDRRLFIALPAASERASTLHLIVVGDQAEPHLDGTAWS